MEFFVRRLARPVATILLMALAIALTGLFVPYFASFDNVVNILIQASFIALVAFGMTLVIVTGGIDLSVGGLMSLVGVVEADLIVHHAPWPIAVLAGLATGAASGTVNAMVVGRLKLPPFIATFATLGVSAGLALYLAPSTSETVNFPDAFTSLGTGSFGRLPYLVLITLLFLVVLQVLYGTTRLGIWLRATGDALPMARLRGVPVVRVLAVAYISSGVLAAASGTLLAANLTTAGPLQGSPYTLWAVAACVIGGVDLFGGHGELWAAGLGAVFLAAVQNVLDLKEVQPFISDMLTGLLIIVAVLITVRAPEIRRRFITAVHDVQVRPTR
jgi:ribose transport system permease protein